MNYIEQSAYAKKAMDLFKEGYNCSQAVFLAFEDKYDIDRKVALMLSSSFGGGMGRLREVCGAVSGMFMVAGVLYGYDDPKDYDKKKEHDSGIQDTPSPLPRPDDYYTNRPRAELVGMAAAIMERYIAEESGL